MMKYLDYSRMPSILKRFFSEELIRQSRLVGAARDIESDYFEIIRFFGRSALDPSQVLIERVSHAFDFDDQRIAQFAVWAEGRLRREGRLYRGPMATAVVGTDFRSQKPSLIIQPCDYGKQAGSSFALDIPHETLNGRTLREYYLDKCATRSIEENPLALCLGVCCLVISNESEDPALLVVRRASHLASLENSIGPSAAGSVDWDEGPMDLGELIETSMTAEIQEELDLERNRYDLTPLAWAREIYRGERPQIFCLLRVSMGREELQAHMAHSSSTSGEVSSFDVIDLEDYALQDAWLKRLNHEARMNWWLVREWLMENR